MPHEFARGAIDYLSLRRQQLHHDQPEDSIGHSVSQERVGIIGEFAFGEFCGLMPDLSDRKRGDGGIDFRLPLIFTVDVKTARKADYLIHKQNKIVADIYVLAEYDKANDWANLLGWAMGSTLRATSCRDFGYGVMNHHIPRDELRPMDDLKGRLGQWRLKP